MTRLALALALALAVVLVAAAAIVTTVDGDRAGSAEAASVAAPPGLSAYGRRVWNLEALLRDTFGRREVYF